MRQHQAALEIRTPGRGLHDVTRQVEAIVAESAIELGLCVVYCRHTSCSLLIQENADPSARSDLLEWLQRLAPDGDPRYAHDAEGPDDMPSHLRAALTSTSETIPIAGRRLQLGTWQGIFLAEHRVRPHSRTLVVHVMGA
jgi:secondary thiamine-phosphate synthase enzyme